MAFEKIKDSQPKVVQLLTNSFKKNRLSHAYLFEGEMGTKKFETALYFAQMLLCTEENKPCGVCHNCRRIPHFTHPNVYVIEPIKNTIRKQQITDLQAEFAKTSVEPGPKIYIIKEIDKIHVNAANSLLKFLEEPHSNIYAILTTSNINKILPTIISRSQIVQFSTLNKKIIEDDLLESGFSKDISKIIPNITNSVVEGEQIASNEAFLEILDLVKDIYTLLKTKEESVIIYFNENNSIIYQDELTRNLFISLMILFQKDILLYKEEDIKDIIFYDALDTIQDIALNKDKNRLIDELEHMLSLKGKLNSYINFSLAYDNLLLLLERR